MRLENKWVVMGILSAAVLGALPSAMRAVRGQDVGAEKVRGEETSPDDESKKVDPKKDVEAKEEKKDPTDIRNTIGNLSLVRGLDELKKPKPKGLWEQLVDQPYFTPAVRAKKLLFHGQYAEAEKKYEELLKGEGGAANQEYLEGYLDSIVQQGRMEGMKKFDEKVAGLGAAQRDTAKVTRLRAESLLFRGRVSEAREILKRFTETHTKLDAADPETLTTYNQYGEALEDAAEYAAALGIYSQVEAVAVGGFPDDPQAATQITLAVYRKGVLSGTGKAKYNSVLAELAAIEEKDQTYWPAKLVQAQVLLNSHNNKDGGKLLDEVISLNPNEIETRFLAIENAISGYNFEMARTQLEEVKSRTDSALADAFEGRLLLKERLPQQAVGPLLAAIKKNPQLPQARGWLAGAYFLLVDQAKMKDQLEAIRTGEGVEGLHPVALFEAGEILRDARQFTQAEKLYLQARHTAKWWSEPSAALAQLYLETGQEKEAKEAYDASFAIDPYNRRAFNQLKLLEYLQKFATLESKTRLREGSNLPAFIIKYDTQDEVLAELAMQWMEKVRPEIWSYFQVQELPAPTQIEFFPSHEQFGVRTTGLPWIGTVGASTGHVIAMDVPRGGAKDMMGAFDWARVLRHEYTHTVTLAITNNRIPHWLTEAAACEQEQAPRDWDNCQLLAANFRAGELFTIANLNWGFIRPKRSIDRQLAYMESQWLYQYLVATYGLPKMIEFMHAFRDGATEAAAWPKVYGKTMEQMDKEFLAWGEKQIESWGLPTDKLPKRAELEAAIKKDDKDVESLVKLAYVLAGSGNGKKSKEYLQKALELEPKHLRARELLGAVLAQGKEPDKEKGKELLEGVVKDDPKRPVAVRTLGVLAMGRRDFDEAEKWFSALQELRPLDDASYTNLAGIYLVKKDYPKAIAQLLELQRHEQKDERIPRKLAQLFQQQGELREAEESAYKSIRINPYNAINHELMAQVLMQEKQPERSLQFWTAATELQPKVGEFWEGLAEARGLTGDKDGASKAAKQAMELNPKSPAEKWMIKE